MVKINNLLIHMLGLGHEESENRGPEPLGSTEKASKPKNPK